MLCLLHEIPGILVSWKSSFSSILHILPSPHGSVITTLSWNSWWFAVEIKCALICFTHDHSNPTPIKIKLGQMLTWVPVTLSPLDSRDEPTDRFIKLGAEYLDSYFVSFNWYCTPIKAWVYIFCILGKKKSTKTWVLSSMVGYFEDCCWKIRFKISLKLSKSFGFV